MCQAWDGYRHSVVTMASRLGLAAFPQSKGGTAKLLPRAPIKVRRSIMSSLPRIKVE